jgi:putative chitinase
MNDTVFFEQVRATTLFGGTLSQRQVDGINAILAAWRTLGDGDDRNLAYILGTVYREAGRDMYPIEEFGKGRGHAYGVPTGPWHLVYDGRGDVQITWEANYVKATAELHKRGMFLDVDLDKNPELALRPDIAAAVLVLGMLEGWFTGRKLSDYITATACNFVSARAIVNGTDVAPLIAGYANTFLAALTAVASAAPSPATVPAVPYPPLAKPTPLPKPKPEPTGLLWLIVTIISAIGAALQKGKAKNA